MHKSDFFRIPNILSVSRIFLSPFAGYCIVYVEWFWCIGLICFMALTDFLDGYLGRKWNQVSAFGKFIDPIADKISIAIVLCAFVISQRVPVWFFIFFFVRDLIIAIGGGVLLKKKDIVVQASFHGKVSSTVFFILVIILLLEGVVFSRYFVQGAIFLAFVTAAISTILYAFEFFTRIRNL